MSNKKDGSPLTRADFLRVLLFLASETIIMRHAGAQISTDHKFPPSGDYTIGQSSAMLFPHEAPLVPVEGKRDACAVWARVLSHADSTTPLVYLHGNNNYVTIDSRGQSRVPDWAEDDALARAGAIGKKAAPLNYELDKIQSGQIGGKTPILLVPEDAILRSGAFWASEPAGQYADSKRLGRLVQACLLRLATLNRSDGSAMLGPLGSGPPKRLYLCGHSGAGLPLQEAAASEIALPAAGVPTDLWLFDCTYWSNVANFSNFCSLWHKAGHLSASKTSDSRFVCVYRPKTQTEEIADSLRAEIARTLGLSPDSLVKDHAGDNYSTDIAPALRESGVLFIRTTLPHDDIPTFFIPHLLETAA